MRAIALRPGFGHYELLAKIGEGPRGPVFVARATGDGGEALYVLEMHAFASDEDEAMKTFARDIERAARIEHSNVVRIVEIGASTAGPYVVMDHVEGCTFSEIQDRHRAVRPPRLVLAAVIDALYGLDAAHSLSEDGVAQPLIHGSVAPEHLILGLDGICRLLGFGSARPRVQTKPSHGNRAAVGYSAPEQLNGGELDHRTDLFSAGVVLWNALTGKQLFHDRIDHLTMTNVLERKVPRPSTIGLCPPPAFDAVVLKALERDPARRFQSAAEMSTALCDVASAAACVASMAEVSEWVHAAFGSDLALRRRRILEIAARVTQPLLPRQAPMLPPLGGAAPVLLADELALGDLARAPDVRAQTPVPTTRHGHRPRRARRPVTLVAIAAFAVVVGVLGWRWATTSTGGGQPGSAAGSDAQHPPRIGLAVTILDVHTAPSPVPAPALPAPAPPAPEPPAVAAPAPPADSAPAAAAAPSTSPASRAEPVVAPPTTRPPPARTRPRQRVAPPRAVETRQDPPPARPPDPRPEPPPPPKVDPPPRPALENNPYIYK